MELCTTTRVPVKVGDTVDMVMSYSEVCLHLKVAGKLRRVRVLERGAQILNGDGSNFSFPISHAEAGIQRHANDMTVETRVAEWVEQESADGRVWHAELAEPWVTVSLRPVEAGVWALSARSTNTDLDYLLHGRRLSRKGLTLSQAQEWAVGHVKATVRGLARQPRRR